MKSRCARSRRNRLLRTWAHARPKQSKNTAASNSVAPFLSHIPPIRQVSSGRQHCGLNGEKRCEKTDVAPKKARYFRLDGRAGEFEKWKVRAGGSAARSRKRKENLEKSVGDDRRHLQPVGPTHQQQEKRKLPAIEHRKIVVIRAKRGSENILPRRGSEYGHRSIKCGCGSNERIRWSGMARRFRPPFRRGLSREITLTESRSPASFRPPTFTVLMCPQAARVVLRVEKSLELYKRTQL